MAQAYGLGGRGVQPNRWLQLSVRQKGMAAVDGPGSEATGMGGRAVPVVAALGAPKGDGSP